MPAGDAVKLTAREFEVRDLLSLGLQNKEIAERLGIGIRTVESHRAEIFRKMGVRNAVELLRKTMGTANA
jgi:DNA-binding NarL/FixJ family response regulator